MISSKQRAALRAMANSLKPVVNIGKDGINETVLKSIEDALEARELIKVNVLENAPMTSREAISEVTDTLNAEPVQVIGNKFVIYRRSIKKPTIKL